jgi:hypothetical protein
MAKRGPPKSAKAWPNNPLCPTSTPAIVSCRSHDLMPQICVLLDIKSSPPPNPIHPPTAPPPAALSHSSPCGRSSAPPYQPQALLPTTLPAGSHPSSRPLYLPRSGTTMARRRVQIRRQAWRPELLEASADPAAGVEAWAPSGGRGSGGRRRGPSSRRLVRIRRRAQRPELLTTSLLSDHDLPVALWIRWQEDFRWRLLTINSCIKVHLDLQADKSPVVVKGPFIPRVVNPRYRIRGTMCNARIQSSKAR